EPPRSAAVLLGAHGGLVSLPVLPVGRIGDQVVERDPGVAVVGERAPKGDLLGVSSVRRFHEEIGLAERPGLGIDLLTEEVDLGCSIDGSANEITILADAQGGVFLRDRQNYTRSAARVVGSQPHNLLAAAVHVASTHAVYYT